MKTRVFHFTKGSAGRMKFAQPLTSGTLYFKQLNFFFFGNTKTHICIHLWTKICCKECASCRYENHVSKRQRSCWLILVSWPTERKSSPFSNCVPDTAATFAIVNMGATYLRSRGSISFGDVYFSAPCYFCNPPILVLFHSGFPDERWPHELWPSDVRWAATAAPVSY